MTWRIVSDSSCDLAGNASFVPTVGFACVPLKIRVDEEEFVDDAALDVDDMLSKMSAYNGPTSSACPSPADWMEEYKKADNIIAITITSALSGSYNSAVVARDMILEQYPEKNIHVIDTLATAGKMVLLIRHVQDLILQELDFVTVAKKADIFNDECQLLFVLASFDNLVKNGRMSKLVGFIAGAFGMRAVGKATDKGELGILYKARGGTRALAFMLEEIDRHADLTDRPVVITHCQNLEDATLLRHGILAKWPTARVTMMETRGLTSYYAQRKGILIGY